MPKDFSSSRPEGICFTFDDAYVSAVELAPSILEHAGYRGAFYAVPSLVGMSSDWDGERARPLATWGELLAIHNRGHEVGNHTMSHARLAELNQMAQLEEIEGAQLALLERGLESNSICFPYGSYDDQTLAVMNKLGIKVGLKLAKGPVLDESAFALNRIVVAFSDNLPKLLYKIHLRPRLR